jgi:hypothetical protein
MDDGRQHWQDGPIDLIVEAFGDVREVERAYQAGWLRFETALEELCAELSLLRARAAPESPRPAGRIAGRMFDVVIP